MGMKSEKWGETADNWPERLRSVKSRGQFARIANLAPTSLHLPLPSPHVHAHPPPLFSGPVDEGDENRDLAGNIWMTRSVIRAGVSASPVRLYTCFCVRSNR